MKNLMLKLMALSPSSLFSSLAMNTGDNFCSTYLGTLASWTVHVMLRIINYYIVITRSQTGCFLNRVINLPFTQKAISTMVSMTFENVPMAFKRWVGSILPRVTGKCITCVHRLQRVTCRKVPNPFPLEPRVV